MIISQRQKLLTIALALSMMLSSNVSGQLVAHFPMDVKNGEITELQSGNSFKVISNHHAESIPGAEGNALRLDGYTTNITTQINTTALNTSKLTMSLWCAVETYPVMADQAVNKSTYIAGNLDNNNHTGFAFTLTSQGDYAFEYYSNGWKISCIAPNKLQKNKWNHLAAVIDNEVGTVTLYRNGELVASSKSFGEINIGNSSFIIGKSFEDIYARPFLLNAFNGLIDDIKIFNTALSLNEINYRIPQNIANLKIPASRFENDILRPVFHGMPAASWTNEPHGLIKYNDKYHIFFQKNANGPYMARLHWGHISSDNLYKWDEEDIALAPSEEYDLKGCWSGCVFLDDDLTNSKPNIFYTAVDNAKATICQATPNDNDLIKWSKSSQNPVINGRPSGLSDDFRDPYIFKSNGDIYMIVGTSKDGKGATTLHKYDKATKKWSNNGDIFYSSNNATISGSFWEMPTITKVNGKWLLTTTPLGTRQGVETQYFVGNINNDGTFAPLPSFTNIPQEVELGQFGKEGYGLLSPSITQVGDKTIAIGIVPDKLPSQNNYDLGWAHTYSLPREWNLDATGLLMQKPFSGLQSMRTTQLYASTASTINGAQSLLPVAGRKVEVMGEFKIGSSSRFGFKFFKTGENAVELYYVPAENKLVVDMRSTERLVNDQNTFNGLYESILPKQLNQGEIIKINAFIDHSIMDIFINDTWAFSIRVFPTNANANEVEVFSIGNTDTNYIKAWNLDEKAMGGGGVSDITSDKSIIYSSDNSICFKNIIEGSTIAIYKLDGKLLIKKNNSNTSEKIEICNSGIFIVKVINTMGVLTQKIAIR
ncbi:MAG: LamG-like jellyroll fold domain-containing protein [Muribaculaceae bacterium]